MAKLNNKKTEKLCINEEKKFYRKDPRGQFHQRVYAQLISMQIPKVQKAA